MIKRIWLLLLGAVLLLGTSWLAYVMFIHQLVNPESVLVFNLDLFGYLSGGIFGGVGLGFIAFSYRLSEVVKNKNIDVSAKKIWTLVIVFSFVGVTINYTNYFVNIKGKGLVECEFHVQRHKDWMLNKYARTQEDCEKVGGREVSK